MNQDLDGSSLSILMEHVHKKRNPYMNQSTYSILYSIWVSITLWTTILIFTCFGHNWSSQVGFLVPWNYSCLNVIEFAYLSIWKASFYFFYQIGKKLEDIILMLLIIPQPFIWLKTISISLLFYLVSPKMLSNRSISKRIPKYYTRSKHGALLWRPPHAFLWQSE